MSGKELRPNNYSLDEVHVKPAQRNVGVENDYYPHKTSRPTEKGRERPLFSDNENGDDVHQVLSSLNSPLASVRYGQDQRRFQFEGKAQMDQFAQKLYSDESILFADGEKLENPKQRNIGSQSSNVEIVDISNLGSLDEVRHMANLSEMQRPRMDQSGGVPSQKKRSTKEARKSLFLENLGFDLMRYEEGRSQRSQRTWDIHSQYDSNIHVLSHRQQGADENVVSVSNLNKPSTPLNDLGVMSKSQKIKCEKGKYEGLKGVWKKRSLVIIYLVRKFVNDMKKYSETWRFRHLSLTQFSTIQDVCGDEEVFIEQRNQQLGIQKDGFITFWSHRLLHFLLSEGLLIRPDSQFKLFWDSIILIIIFINIFFIPINFCFTGQHTPFISPFLKICLSDLPCWAFLADVVIRSNTAIYSKGQLITQKMKIFSHYIKESLLIDMIIIIPFLISLKFEVPYLNAILLLWTNRMMSIPENIEQMLNLSPKKSAMVSLAKLAITMFFVAHFCGCLFFYMGTISSSDHNISDQSWIDQAKILDQTFINKYTTCLYWAIITMITVGYGDIIPLRVLEKQTVIVIVILSCGVYAYIINVIGIIMQDITKENQMFKKKMRVLSSYMNKRGISNEQQQSIKKYFNYRYEEDLKFNEGGDIFFNELKGQLKTNALQDIYFKLLNQSKLFRMNFSQGFLKRLSSFMEEQKYVCDEIILNLGEECTALYFTFRGEVQSIVDGGKVIGYHQKGSIFDEIQFFSQGRSQLQYKSSVFSTLVFIRRETFAKTLKEFPKDFEKYCMMRDKISLYKNLRNFEHSCSLCSSFKHTMRECLFVNPQFNDNKILYNYNKVCNQERNADFIRRDPSSFLEDIKSNINQIKDTIIHYLIEVNPAGESNAELFNTVKDLVDQDNLETNQSSSSFNDKIEIQANHQRTSLSCVQDVESESSANRQNKDEASFNSTPIHMRNGRNKSPVYGPTSPIMESFVSASSQSRQCSNLNKQAPETKMLMKSDSSSSQKRFTQQVIFQKPKPLDTRSLSDSQMDAVSLSNPLNTGKLPTVVTEQGMPQNNLNLMKSQITQKGLLRQSNQQADYNMVQTMNNQELQQNIQEMSSNRQMNYQRSLFQTMNNQVELQESDKLFHFQIYFPEGNYDVVLKLLHTINEKKSAADILLRNNRQNEQPQFKPSFKYTIVYIPYVFLPHSILQAKIIILYIIILIYINIFQIQGGMND